MKQYIVRHLVRFLTPLLLFLAAWQVVAWILHMLRGVPFPTPLTTGDALVGLVRGVPLADHAIATHLRDSLWRWGAGFSISAVLGSAYGLAAGWFRRLEHATAPILLILQVIPGLAWIPVAILCFGIGETATIFMIAMTAFPPVALNVMAGVKQLDPHLIRAARMLGADGTTMLFFVLLPGALPGILTGLRIGLGTGWRVLVAAEMVVGSGTGLGYSIIQSRWTLDYDAAFACIGIVCLIGLAVEHLVFAPLERVTTGRWRLEIHAR